ncbi:MAG: hypothetical protein H6745_05985 [Deltaproteobacteria bacterium]|nr:hypothetical protein [Deltaproteobacteria bacterium]
MTRRLVAQLSSATLTAAALAACGSGDPSPGVAAAAPQVAIDVAALSLTGVGDVVWDLEVVDDQDAPVWQRRVTSSRYGDGTGSFAFVGPCAGAAGGLDNEVHLWVVGLYEEDAITSPGAFAAGATTGPGAVVGTALPFDDPTATAPLTRTVSCRPNEDARADFLVTLMRPASQGFFDVAVTFDDIFCSAKFDCCADDDVPADGCDGDGSEDIDLLFDAAGARGRTNVLAIACTAGAGGGATDLYMSALELDCDVTSDAQTFAADLTIRPDATTPGNLCVAGSDGVSACRPWIEEAPGVDGDDYLFQVAAFMGQQAADASGADVRYWNVALGVKPAISACRLRATATADDGGDDGDSFVGGVVADGAVYPAIAFDVDLGSCGAEALSSAPGAAVRTAYSASGDGATRFLYGVGPTAVTAPHCDPICAHGNCRSDGTCDCGASGYEGAACDQPICTTPCAHGSCGAPEVCDCEGTGYGGVLCDAPVCDPACGADMVCSAPDTCTPAPFAFQASQVVVGRTVTCSATNQTAEYTECTNLLVDGKAMPNGMHCTPGWYPERSRYSDTEAFCNRLTHSTQLEAYYDCPGYAWRASYQGNGWAEDVNDNGLTVSLRCYYP